MGKSTIHKIIKKTCDALWEVLKDEVLPKPTEETWKRIESGFRTRWQFPNCIGALDGKQVMTRKSINSGSKFWSYKGYNSIVLMALVGHKYRFSYVDIRAYGSNSDGNVFRSSEFGHKLLTLNIPAPKLLPNYASHCSG